MTSTIDAETEKALTEFVMDSADLSALEALLSCFNIFRILRAARHEIRHSNMLAWLLTPDENHGVGDHFFRRWLMQIVYDAGDETQRQLGLPSPIEIDSLDIESVEVARESDNIDLLIKVHATSGALWVICIENKVESKQHSNQLRRYREIVERRYAAAEQRLFVFLTKYDEEPQDVGFVTSTYAMIEAVLRRCLEERKDMIGAEPKLLLSQYLELLAGDFVEESKAAQLARKIYRSHRKAIDFIIENRADPVSEVTSVLQEIIAAHAGEFGIIVDGQGEGWIRNKGYVRFLPETWNVPQNTGGTGWGTNSRIVLCEIKCWTKVELHITVGKAPDSWADKVWERAKSAPFRQEQKQRPVYFKPFKSKSDIVVETLGPVDIHFSQIMAATRNSTDANDKTVFS